MGQGVSDRVGDGPQVRDARLTPAGRKQLETERAKYTRFSKAITAILDNA
jgi:hypothetical protein